MAVKKWYVVTAENGLNLRESPSLKANILKVFDWNDRIEADNSIKAPDGWIAIKGGGFVMRQFVK
jgi:hypothetical protein